MSKQGTQHTASRDSEQAMHEMDRHNMDRQNAAAASPDEAIPAADSGGHDRSAAAHLGGTVHDHTKPAGDLRKSIDAVEPRQPPQEVSRIGKDHRRQ
jgi:hypothetical protein